MVGISSKRESASILGLRTLANPAIWWFQLIMMCSEKSSGILDKLKNGDEVILFTNARQYVYTVTNTQIVEPTETEVMKDTPNSTIVTLISCYPYMVDKQRIVVSAVLQK